MRDVTSRLYIVSTYRPEFTENENYARLLKAKAYLEDMGLTSDTAIGHYENTVEKSLVVLADNNAERHIKRVSDDYNQDAYLVVYWDRAAELVLKDGSRNVLGFWTQTEDRSLPGLTILNDLAFTIKKAA